MSKIALIYGSSGALGGALVSAFVSAEWKVIGIDFRPISVLSSKVKSNSVLAEIIPSLEGDLETRCSFLVGETGKALNGQRLDSIVCVAGGWAGGNCSDPHFAGVVELMFKQSVETSIISAKLANQYLQPQGLLLLTAATAALGPTPGMIGYGMAKAAVLHLVSSLAEGSSSGLATETKVAAILPITLDTPANRAAMPKADFSSWTPCSDLATQILQWSQAPSKSIAKNGSLFKVETISNVTKYTLIV